MTKKTPRDLVQSKKNKNILRIEARRKENKKLRELGIQKPRTGPKYSKYFYSVSYRMLEQKLAWAFSELTGIYDFEQDTQALHWNILQNTYEDDADYGVLIGKTRQLRPLVIEMNNKNIYNWNRKLTFDFNNPNFSIIPVQLSSSNLANEMKYFYLKNNKIILYRKPDGLNLDSILKENNYTSDKISYQSYNPFRKKMDARNYKIYSYNK